MVGSKSYVINGDVGCGPPGSLSWHKCAVAEMNKDERLVYFREVLPDMTADDVFEFTVFLIHQALVEALNNGDGN